MATNVHTERWTYRLGRGVGRAWCVYGRREHRVAGWLTARGIPAAWAKALLWIVKLVLLGMLLCFAFWLALLLVFVVAVALAAYRAGWDDERETEWRTGISGYGLYRGDVRIDVGDPYEDDD